MRPNVTHTNQFPKVVNLHHPVRLLLTFKVKFPVHGQSFNMLEIFRHEFFDQSKKYFILM